MSQPECDICHVCPTRRWRALMLIFHADGGKFPPVDEQGLAKTDSHWTEQISELQALLAEVKPLLVAAEVELSERLAAISEFEFKVRSFLEPLTRRLDDLDEEIRVLRRELRQLQEDLLFGEEKGDDDLYDQWRSSAGAGAAASGDYRYRSAPPRPPEQKLSADQSAELKQLYRQLARRFHPDFALDKKNRAYRTKMMIEINAAYALGNLARLQELALEPDPEPKALTDEDLAEALLRELYRCRKRMEEVELELLRLEEHPSAELMRRAQAAERAGRDLLDELASELRERIASKMVRRDVLQDEIDSLGSGGSEYTGDDLAQMVYDLGLEQAFEEDPMAGFSEWRDRNWGRIDLDDIPDEEAWEEWRRMRDRPRKKR